jgi:hypothetical protein
MVASAISFGAMAQTSTTSPIPNSSVDNNAPLPGANSFTEGQAKSRLEANGYSDIAGLKKDEKGVWKGTAMNAGAKVDVSVDYRGNIVRH